MQKVATEINGCCIRRCTVYLPRGSKHSKYVSGICWESLEYVAQSWDTPNPFIFSGTFRSPLHSGPSLVSPRNSMATMLMLCTSLLSSQWLFQWLVRNLAKLGMPIPSLPRSPPLWVLSDYGRKGSGYFDTTLTACDSKVWNQNGPSIPGASIQKL